VRSLRDHASQYGATTEEAPNCTSITRYGTLLLVPFQAGCMHSPAYVHTVQSKAPHIRSAGRTPHARYRPSASLPPCFASRCGSHGAWLKTCRLVLGPFHMLLGSLSSFALSRCSPGGMDPDPAFSVRLYAPARKVEELPTCNSPMDARYNNPNAPGKGQQYFVSRRFRESRRRVVGEDVGCTIPMQKPQIQHDPTQFLLAGIAE
jgi:hypothetical protein